MEGYNGEEISDNEWDQADRDSIDREDDEIFAYECVGCMIQYDERTPYCDICGCENEPMYF